MGLPRREEKDDDDKEVEMDVDVDMEVEIGLPRPRVEVEDTESPPGEESPLVGELLLLFTSPMFSRL